jgi:3-hydroxyisobutyrate dehydrogenase
MTTERAVAFIGLGVMGYPVAGHLARAGHAVTVYNRAGAKAERFAREFPPAPLRRRARRPRAPMSCSLALAMTTICAP